MKRAIVYYSLTGCTKMYAERLAKELECDLIRLETIKEFPTEYKSQILYGGMLVTFGLKPPLKPLEKKIEEYDELILGLPVWAGKQAAPINTFLKNYKVQDKVIAIFTLSGSGNNEKCLERLKAKLKKVKITANIIEDAYDKNQENEAKFETLLKSLKA